jgi:hypothetical protein
VTRSPESRSRRLRRCSWRQCTRRHRGRQLSLAQPTVANLAAELIRLEVLFLRSRTPGAQAMQLPPAMLLAGLAASDEARLRLALIPFLLAHSRPGGVIGAAYAAGRVLSQATERRVLRGATPSEPRPSGRGRVGRGCEGPSRGDKERGESDGRNLQSLERGARKPVRRGRAPSVWRQAMVQTIA